MIDHVSIYVRNLLTSKRFYEAAFKTLGYTVSFGDPEGTKFFAFDIGNDCLFEIMQLEGDLLAGPSHVAFRVANKDLVHRFYEAAIEAGGTCNGKPGPRPQYTDKYYACFIRDPDGYNIEVMMR